MKLWLKDDLASRKIVVQRAVFFSAVTLFILIVFQPFGTNNHSIPYKFLRLSGYGLVSFCALLLSGALEIIATRLKIKNQIRVVVVPLIYVGIVSVFNHSYFVVAILGSWHWENQLLFVLYTCAIGLFPIIFIYLANHHSIKTTFAPHTVEPVSTISNFNETLNTVEPTPPQLLTLTGENKSDKIQIALSQILYIKSADNYCELAIVDNNNFSQKLLRSSLTGILKQLPEKSLLLRCHRSFAVNLSLVGTSSGNAGGLKLTMKPIDVTVPVSRTYVDTIKQALLLVPKTC